MLPPRTLSETGGAIFIIPGGYQPGALATGGAADKLLKSLSHPFIQSTFALKCWDSPFLIEHSMKHGFEIQPPGFHTTLFDPRRARLASTNQRWYIDLGQDGAIPKATEKN